MFLKKCRPIGGYVPGAPSSWSERLHPACALCRKAAQISSNRRWAGGGSGVAGKARWRAGGPCAIDIKDLPIVSLSIPQPTWLLLLLQRPGDQIFKKHRAQCLNRWLIEGSKK